MSQDGEEGMHLKAEEKGRIVVFIVNLCLMWVLRVTILKIQVGEGVREVEEEREHERGVE